MFAFVMDETVESLKRLFLAFKDIMGNRCDIRTMVMDKMAAQMRAAQDVFGCDIYLCYFHIRQSIQRHVCGHINLMFL